jgi:hypothetical protein
MFLIISVMFEFQIVHLIGEFTLKQKSFVVWGTLSPKKIISGFKTPPQEAQGGTTKSCTYTACSGRKYVKITIKLGPALYSTPCGLARPTGNPFKL